ncbi:unnamed protein product, partial [Mesorhabditis spiculigera]
MARVSTLLLFTAALINYAYTQTPVIGGSCKVGTADVQIGGKQTQFFLKCEATAESTNGEGVWVVKSRSAASPTAAPTTSAPAENTQPQQRPPMFKYNPNICEQDNGAREGDSCTVSATCLQANLDNPTTFLQCEQASQRWIKKSCQDTYIFNFEQQACIVPKRNPGSLHRKLPDSFKSSLIPINNLTSNPRPANKPCARCEDGCPNGTTCSKLSGCCRPLIFTSPRMKFKDYVSGYIEAEVISESGKEPGKECLELSCTTPEDCPPTFACETGTCRLMICPVSAARVRFKCKHKYHCRASEECILGGCCPKREMNSTTPGSVDNMDVYRSIMSTMQTRQYSKTTTTILPITTTAPKTSYEGDEAPSEDGCQLDQTFLGQCSMESPCSDEAECRDGKCCFLMQGRCANTLMPLAYPASCSEAEECPFGSSCEESKCCPAEEETTTATVATTTIARRPRKPKAKDPCLDSHQCNATSLCPPEFTCSLTGQCCRYSQLCPDRTVPEALCGDAKICPSAEHACMRLGKEHFACCPSDNSSGIERLSEEDMMEMAVPRKFFDEKRLIKTRFGKRGSCPTGSIQVPPKIGRLCRLSIQCPYPYYCQSTSGLVCTFSSCSNSNPCSSGTCNNGYCCSSGSSAPQIIVAQPSSSCNGCQQAPQIISIPVCPGGGSSLGSCGSTGFCATGYQCVQGSCCPSYNQPSISVLSCPGGGQAVGSCISGGCATGYSCSSNNQCCPTTNPFVCNDGTQAAGGCVNGQCGTGYTCSNGLCCASTSSSPKCLDGTAAVGACIPSCTGNGCGGTTLSYYCGSGYTCTTGNICCPTQSCPDGGEPIGPTVNGLCPTGYTAQGNQCCSVVATCLTGEENIGLPINEFCPAGSTLRGTVCCRAALVFAADCIPTVQLANAGCDAAGDACGAGGTVQLGYACRDVDSSLVCCPLVDYTDTSCIIGPVILDSCPIDYTAVFVNGENQCVALSCISGLCDASEQSGPCVSDECPTGYTCNVYAGVCCSDSSTALMRMSRLKTKPTIVMPPRSIFSRPAPQACPSGDEPVSACINGLCGAGLECFNNKLCCPAGTNPSFGSRENLHSLLSAVATQKPKRLCPNGEEALSSCFPDGSCGEDLICLGGVCCGTPGLQFSQAKHRNTSIGTSCSSSQQCAGFTEGLSKCERRVCRCTSIAYAKGIACVRKKMLMFNDEPMPVDSNSVIAAAPPS